MAYVDDNINSNNAITPTNFLSMNPKNGTPLLTEEDGKGSDYRPIKETSSSELLKLWKKGQVHLNNL